MSNTLPIVAAIPNYNMAVPLGELLPQVLEQDYAAVYVLDDASTDESRDVVMPYDGDVTFVAGKENKGSGGNRNRIMEALGHRPATIHFFWTPMYDYWPIGTRKRSGMSWPTHL